MDESSPAAAARLIQFALLSGVVLFAVVIGVITDEAGPIADADFHGPIAWIGGAFALLCTGIAFWLRNVLPTLMAKVTALSPRERAVRAGLLPAATLEAAMLFNLVGWLVRNDPWPTAVFALLPFCCAVAFLIQPIELEEPRQ
jgi:hypothetical protein